MIPLPDSPNIRLEFHIGLREGSEKSDGVTFIVSVQDNEIFRQHYNQQRWEPVNLDLSLYRDQIVKLRFYHHTRAKWRYWLGLGSLGRTQNHLCT